MAAEPPVAARRRGCDLVVVTAEREGKEGVESSLAQHARRRKSEFCPLNSDS